MEHQDSKACIWWSEFFHVHRCFPRIEWTRIHHLHPTVPLQRHTLEIVDTAYKNSPVYLHNYIGNLDFKLFIQTHYTQNWYSLLWLLFKANTWSSSQMDHQILMTNEWLCIVSPLILIDINGGGFQTGAPNSKQPLPFMFEISTILMQEDFRWKKIWSMLFS